jgi:protein-S-isoprenylcysteine O-methyltransferase Ste14
VSFYAAQLCIGAMWLVFTLVWIGSALFAKRSAGGSPASRYLAVFIVLLAVLLPRSTFGRAITRVLLRPPASRASAVLALGVVLTALGAALAIFARVHLGSNWGLPASQRQHPELVMSGPYAVVRHPIYTGLLLAIMGSMLASVHLWLFMLAIDAAYVIPSAFIEERMMARKFPAEYPAYHARTKMFIPWIL